MVPERMSRMRNILEYLEESTERFPEKIAVTDGVCAYNYRELSMRSRRIGSAVAARCKQEQPVAVLAEKGQIRWLFFLGLFRLAVFMF